MPARIAILRRALLSALALAAIAAPAPAQDCGGPEAPCSIDGGQYRIVMPDRGDGATGAVPALMFLHGWGGSGRGVLRMGGLVATALERGYAVIAPDGLPRRSGRGLSWGFHPQRPGPRDEIAFLQAVRDDAVDRHGLDPARMLLGGFSIGGSMTSYVACAAPDAFAAYVPVAGAFWVPTPANCAGPVSLLHTHGWRDTVVPLEGRILRQSGDTVFAQADVWQAMQVWRAAGGCPPNAGNHGQSDDFLSRDWTDCNRGGRLGFALHDGGHAVPQGWTAMMLDWVERR